MEDDINIDAVYNEIEPFCRGKCITLKSLRLSYKDGLSFVQGYFYEYPDHLVVNPLKNETPSFWIHYDFIHKQALQNYLIERLDFKSKVKERIDYLSSILKAEDDIYQTSENNYYLDENNKLQLIKTFHLIDEFSQPSLIYAETVSDDIDFSRLDDHFFTMYVLDNNSVPDELKKPFHEMSESEMNLLSMIFM